MREDICLKIVIQTIMTVNFYLLKALKVSKAYCNCFTEYMIISSQIHIKLESTGRLGSLFI